MVKVSVIIPTYNRADILLRAIKSALEQNYGSMEVIIVDDNSSDGTPDIVNNIPDTRIKYIYRSKNGGVAATRNDGLRIAKGEYVAFLDSDDIWASGKIEAQLKVFDENKSVGMSYTNADIISNNGNKLFIDKTVCSRIVYGATDRTSGIFPGVIMVTPPGSWMLRRSVVNEIGFFDETMRVWEDCDYFVRIAQRSDIYFLNVPLLRINTGNDDRLSCNASAWHESKKLFYAKYFSLMSNDKQYLFLFYKGMGKDCLALKNRDDAIGWFVKALRIKPFDANLYWKIIKACTCRTK